jgi:hypothetical protein
MHHPFFSALFPFFFSIGMGWDACRQGHTSDFFLSFFLNDDTDSFRKKNDDTDSYRASKSQLY